MDRAAREFAPSSKGKELENTREQVPSWVVMDIRAQSSGAMRAPSAEPFSISLTENSSTGGTPGRPFHHPILLDPGSIHLEKVDGHGFGRRYNRENRSREQ